ncbi:16S rRNA (cytidine(1402)-2'-O)-methyltransferase [Anoxynatronum buryatiense]|uniref:Ribosomal RNA small subunit methyltransferase I n=1 Tax=Anoxynatronum buryatiense TaxID=489973 RepID=A0AA46AJ16_9CLOT|nr:16S rRNA (cytidine(1402)-2'-O)-methyltransferase [Anoxynatronum buryatiense]SMP56535.1 16S rRNA (cytidine1402-2'-O)-methyltransferase [Anoxynatronum buryatiense]
MTATPETNEHRFIIQPGTLYLCPTPLGNLGDITLRTIEVLQQADLIAAEDTRRSLKLLNHLNIRKSLVSYHEHNRNEKEGPLLEALRQGKAIALITDAGMPGISDPGTHLVVACLRENIPFEVLPGPSAVLLALAASGLSTERFTFEGFLPREKKKQREHLESIRQFPHTLIFYEAPHRILSTLKQLAETLGNRQAALGRELTKRHEAWYRGTLEEIRQQLDTAPGDPKGEMVLAVAGLDPLERRQEDAQAYDHLTIQEQVTRLMATGLSKKEAIKETARLRQIPKREVYSQAIDLEEP